MKRSIKCCQLTAIMSSSKSDNSPFTSHGNRERSSAMISAIIVIVNDANISPINSFFRTNLYSVPNSHFHDFGSRPSRDSLKARHFWELRQHNSKFRLTFRTFSVLQTSCELCSGDTNSKKGLTFPWVVLAPRHSL